MDEDTAPGRFIALHERRSQILAKLEEQRLELQHQFLEKRLQLLSQHKEHLEWLLDTLGDLRKERVSFQKKAIPEIASTLDEAKVEGTQKEAWLEQITDLYHADLSLAQRMISVDFEDFDTDLFAGLKEAVEEGLAPLVDAHQKAAEHDVVSRPTESSPSD